MTMTPSESDSWREFWIATAIVVAVAALAAAMSCASVPARRITAVDCTGSVCLGRTANYSRVVVSSDTLPGDCVCSSDGEWTPCGGCVPR